MIMHNPPHPGDFIRITYLNPFRVSVRHLAKHLKVAPSTINRLINGRGAVSPKMARRLSATLGRSPESWLAMQAQYDLWMTRNPKLKKIDFWITQEIVLKNRVFLTRLFLQRLTETIFCVCADWSTVQNLIFITADHKPDFRGYIKGLQ